MFAAAHAASGDLPRSELKAPPKIGGREVKELVLAAPLHVGKDLPPGLPTTVTYTMAPNRFRPVCEDAEGVFYQALGPLEKHDSRSSGGVYLSKQYPDKILPYRGDARRTHLPVGKFPPLSPAQVRKFRAKFASQRPR